MLRLCRQEAAFMRNSFLRKPSKLFRQKALMSHAKILIEGLSEHGHFGKIAELNMVRHENPNEGTKLGSKTVAFTKIYNFKPSEHLEDVKTKTRTWLLTK